MDHFHQTTEHQDCVLPKKGRKKERKNNFAGYSLGMHGNMKAFMRPISELHFIIVKKCLHASFVAAAAGV